MATATATSTGVELSSLELNLALELVRKDRSAAKAALSAPLHPNDVPQNVTREITSVIGANTATEVRFAAWETIDAHFIELTDGTTFLVESEDVKVYSVVLPNTKMKAGYTAYVMFKDKLESRVPDLGFTAFVVVPAMWRRVLCMPNSRSCFGGVSAWLYQWRKHSWKTKVNHSLCVSDIYELERYVK